MMIWLKATRHWNGANAVFWTYPGTDSDAKQFAGKINGVYFDNLYGNMVRVWSNDDNWEQVFDLMSEALAEVAKSPVYLMLTKDATPKGDSTWVNIEAPVLKRRGVTVKAVDPSSGKVWNGNYLGHGTPLLCNPCL
jgi:hypothetical protein